MLEFFRQTLTAQYEAALAMLNQCIAACPSSNWEDLIAQGSFRWVAYHTLFFADLYLSPHESLFQLRELHRRGGDEREPIAAPGLPKDDALQYVQVCRQKMFETVAAETVDSFAGPSG